MANPTLPKTARRAVFVFALGGLMTSGIIYRLFGATLLCLSTLAYSEITEFQPKFPRTMSWSAYNLGTTGYNQAVGIGKALKDH